MTVPLAKARFVLTPITVSEFIVEGLITPIPTKKVILHMKPDLDGIVAYWLAFTHPEAFPGIQDAELEFWAQGPPPDGRTWQEHEAEGTICFDVGEGRFDHHPHGKDLKHCGADLVARHLMIQDDIVLQSILDYVRMHDLEGPMALTLGLRKLSTPQDLIDKADLLENFSFYSFIDIMRRRMRDEKALVRWTFHALDEIKERQEHFWMKVLPEYLKNVVIERIYVNDRIIKIAIIESDFRRVGSISRTRQGGFCTICIHRVPESGQVYISGHLASEQWCEIAKILRVLEMEKRGITDPYNLAELITSKFERNPIWYVPFNMAGERFIIMNGSEKASSTSPTKLTLDDIKGAVLIGLHEDIFAPECPKTDCRFNACDFYRFGLERCHQLRSSLLPL